MSFKRSHKRRFVNPEKFGLLRGLPDDVDLNDEQRQAEFISTLTALSKEDGNIANIFSRQLIEGMLTDSMSFANGKERFVDFLIMVNYRDKPEGDEASTLRRTTPLHQLARHKCHERLVDKLFKIYDRCDLNYLDAESGLTHFHVACMSGCDKVVRKFLKRGQNPNCCVLGTGDTPLHLAVKNRSRKVIDALLKNGADPNAANAEGSRPLHIIARSYLGADLLGVIFCAKLQLDARDKSGRTPLHLALENGFKDVAEWLLEIGANPNLCDDEGSTSLHIVCRNYLGNDLAGFFRICDEKGHWLWIDAKDKLGNTPLHVAVSRDHRSSIELLLRRGASPNAVNAEGSTPLHLICAKDHDDGLAEMFVEHELVRIEAKDNKGRTPLDLAVANLLPDVMDVLLNHGAELSSFVFPSSFPAATEASKFKRASNLLLVVKRLQQRGYVLSQSDVTALMAFFAGSRVIADSMNLKDRRFNEETFANNAKMIMIRPDLSLYDFTQLTPKKATRRLANKWTTRPTGNKLFLGAVAKATAG